MDPSFPSYDKTASGFGMGTMLDGTGLAYPGCVNDMMVCPYNESHVVSGGKYARHLFKCRRRAEEKAERDGEVDEEVAIEDPTSRAPCVMKICPYNMTHHIHASVMEDHLEVCDSHFIYRYNNQKKIPSTIWYSKMFPDSETDNPPPGTYPMVEDDDDDAWPEPSLEEPEEPETTVPSGTPSEASGSTAYPAETTASSAASTASGSIETWATAPSASGTTGTGHDDDDNSDADWDW